MSLYYQNLLNLEDSILTKTGFYASSFIIKYWQKTVEQEFQFTKEKVGQLIKIFYVYESVPPQWHGYPILYFDIGGTINGEFFNYKNKNQGDILTLLLKLYGLLFGNPILLDQQRKMNRSIKNLEELMKKRTEPMTSLRSAELDIDIENNLIESSEYAKKITEYQKNLEQYLASIFDYNLLSSTKSPENLIDFLINKTIKESDFIILKAYFNNFEKDATKKILKDKTSYKKKPYRDFNFISLEEIYHIRDNNLSQEERFLERDQNNEYFLNKDNIRKAHDFSHNFDDNYLREKRILELDRNLDKLQSYLGKEKVINKSDRINKSIKRIRNLVRNKY